MGSLANRYAQRGATPVGSIIHSGAGSAPSGYLACDGSAVSRTTYALLFATIGTAFGVGNGTTTFNLPNSSGLFLCGSGSQTISSKTFNGGSLANKQKDGTSQNGLSIATVSTPSLSLANTDLTHTHSYSDLTTAFTNRVINPGSGSLTAETSSYTNLSESDTSGSGLGNHTHTVTPSVSSVVTTLSSTASETCPASLTTAAYIKF